MAYGIAVFIVVAITIAVNSMPLPLLLPSRLPLPLLSLSPLPPPLLFLP
jgi:hypothetical protein